MSTLSAKVVLRTDKKPNSKGEYRLMIRLIYKRRIKYPYTFPFSLSKNDWSKQSGAVRVSNRRSRMLNDLISNKLQEIDDIALSYAVRNHNATADGIITHLNKELGDRESKSFFDYAEGYLHEIKPKISRSHHRQLNITVKYYKESVNGEVSFDDMDRVSIKKYQRYLRVEKGNAVNTVSKRVVDLKGIYMNAIKDGLTTHEGNPFFKLTMDKEDTNKNCLEISEIRLLANLDLDPYSGNGKARNAFLFMIFSAGMRVGDLIDLKWQNIVDDEHIRYRMEKIRKKAHAVKHIPLISYTREIIDLYRPKIKRPDDYIFPLLDSDAAYTDDQKYRAKNAAVTYLNKHIKNCADMAGISKNLHNHVARHTFSYLFEEGSEGDVDALQLLLSHTDRKTTDAYRKNLSGWREKKAMKTFETVIQKAMGE